MAELGTFGGNGLEHKPIGVFTLYFSGILSFDYSTNNSSYSICSISQRFFKAVLMAVHIRIRIRTFQDPDPVPTFYWIRPSLIRKGEKLLNGKEKVVIVGFYLYNQ